MCPGIFVKDPETYLKALKIGVNDPIRKGRPAVLDSTMRTYVGHDIFFFSRVAERDRFRKDPLRYVKRLSDPVTKERFAVTRRSPHTEWKGRPYYFASDSTRAKFAATPDSFEVRKGG